MFTRKKDLVGKRSTHMIIEDALKWCLYIKDNPGANTRILAKRFEVSEVMIIRGRRMLKQLGVEIVYRQYRKSSKKKNGLIVQNWGIFNPNAVREYLEEENIKNANSNTTETD